MNHFTLTIIKLLRDNGNAGYYTSILFHMKATAEQGRNFRSKVQIENCWEILMKKGYVTPYTKAFIEKRVSHLFKSDTQLFRTAHLYMSLDQN